MAIGPWANNVKGFLKGNDLIGAIDGVKDLIEDRSGLNRHRDLVKQTQRTNSLAAQQEARNKKNAGKTTQGKTPGNTNQNQGGQAYDPYGYYGGGSAPAIDQASISALERQLSRTQDSIGRISGQEKVALANLLGQRNAQRNKLNTQRADTRADHQRAVGSTTANFGRTKDGKS